MPQLKTKLKENQNKSLDFYSVTDAASSLQAAILYKALENKSLIIILPTNFEAEAYYREMISYIDQEEVYYFPGSETIPYEWAHVPPDIKRDRVLALNRILSGIPSLFIGSVTALLQSVPKHEDVFSRTIEFVPNQEYEQENLLRDLVRLGYERRTICDHFGTFSVKGGIVDIFPSHSRDPIRLDFFGDTLEDIKAFDPLTQRSLGQIPSVTILPADEYILSENEKKEYYNILNSESNLKKPEETLLVVEELIPLIRKNTGLLSYFKKDKPIILASNFEVLQERAFQLEREMKTLYEKKKEHSLACSPEQLLSFEEEFSVLTDKKKPSIRFHRLPPPEGKEDSIIINAKPTVEFKGKIREARETIESVLADEDGSKILITSSFIQQTDRLESLFSTHGIKRLNPGNEEPKLISIEDNNSSRFLLVLSELGRGFELPDDKLIVFTENDIFGRKYKRKTRYKKAPSRAIESFLDLKEGDYVVHINHGVGRFKTIERVTADGKQRDYIKLEYSGSASLFVPLDQISLVQRYVGGTEHPRLDSLGKNNWKKTKERVRESIEKLAEDLVRMYANRLKYKGYAFPPDTIWQEEFEADFEYEETPDQLSAIEAVKSDLENTKPMDRLVCGDVGYGKTEVAIRAAFKVIMAGKQVLLMSPTTILSLQHFNTFSERYASYPIKVGYISRFKTASEIKKSLEDFSKGELDILIGTHAVLSSRMKPKNLGLLIIDEEQKFGVNHKETIKKFKHMVDVLTLTATPIPRTLHMALTGIRDLSIISTPPKNRQTVETYVMEESEEVLIKAIRREIERGGQVFYLYNRVESIESEAKYLTDLLPELSVGILHGQMDDDSIEEILMDFYNKNYDILVTTTIIESGIDMPNVNTLIIKRADTFGLSQLYQIRGRVGRSDKKAYAYLFHPPGRVMTEVAEKRLNTIYEYQELGSGFKVAMRDLEIRGAGNLLGSEQSGDIIEVGFDLYVKMLDEAIARVKGEEIEVEIRTSINLSTNFFLPDDYIPDNRQKIEFYKKFEGCVSLEELEEVEMELIDRFGEPKTIAKTFLLLERIRTVASSLGFESLSEAGDEIRIKSGLEFKGDASSVVNLISKTPGLNISPSEPSILRYKHNAKNEEEKLSKLFNLLIQVQPRKKTKNVMDNPSKS
ncbi:transcription-repair coupling factor [Leptospira sp. GIMC2001]|nr:transcription-repair coupling factor [Leptospira sp. GIMC2001]WCL51356.1 transcription-repair coupling factor [Leptospira sp. GIMC2001]